MAMKDEARTWAAVAMVVITVGSILFAIGRSSSAYSLSAAEKKEIQADHDSLIETRADIRAHFKQFDLFRTETKTRLDVINRKQDQILRALP